MWQKNIIVDKISIGKEIISFSTKFDSLDSLFHFVSSDVNNRISNADVFILNNYYEEFCINTNISGDNVFITTFNSLSEYEGYKLYSEDRYGNQLCPINLDYVDFANTTDSAIIISDLTKNNIKTIYFDAKKALEEIDISDIETRAVLSGDYSLVDKYVFNKYRKYYDEIPMVSITNPISSLTNTPSLSANNLNLIEAVSPKFLLSGMSYNYMFEVPVNSELVFKNCYTGTIKIFAGELKNHYDFWFDVSGKVDVINNEIPIGSAILKNNRIYVSVNCTENNTISDMVYLIYKFGNNYSNPEVVIPNSGYNNVYHKSATIIPVSADSSYIYPNSAYQYEHLEVIYGVNSIGYEGLHKSALFSIKINNSNLVSGINNLTPESIDLIKSTIETIIKDGIKKIIPPYTQLFKIIWNN